MLISKKRLNKIIEAELEAREKVFDTISDKDKIGLTVPKNSKVVLHSVKLGTADQRPLIQYNGTRFAIVPVIEETKEKMNILTGETTIAKMLKHYKVNKFRIYMNVFEGDI